MTSKTGKPGLDRPTYKVVSRELEGGRSGAGTAKDRLFQCGIGRERVMGAILVVSGWHPFVAGPERTKRWYCSLRVTGDENIPTRLVDMPSGTMGIVAAQIDESTPATRVETDEWLAYMTKEEVMALARLLLTIASEAPEDVAS